MNLTVITEESHSAKHSGFSSSFPIYLWTETTKEVPVEEPKETKGRGEVKGGADDDEAVVEDLDDQKDEAPKTKSITIEEWSHLNSAPPLWQR